MTWKYIMSGNDSSNYHLNFPSLQIFHYFIVFAILGQYMLYINYSI